MPTSIFSLYLIALTGYFVKFGFDIDKQDFSLKQLEVFSVGPIFQKKTNQFCFVVTVSKILAPLLWDRLVGHFFGCVF